MSVSSFDVFDTCLTRRVSEPSAVFYDVARRVFARRGLTPTRSLTENFVSARRLAERTARERSSREDITLAEIWSRLPGFMGWEDDPALAECELEAEAATLIAIAATRQRIEASRKRGDRIVFVSDMYLPVEFIRGQLTRHGMAEAGDALYVSSEVGKTKASGALFRHMLEQEKVSAAEVLHLGDHWESDFVAPQRLGLRAEWFSGQRLTGPEIAVKEALRNPWSGVSIEGAMREFRLNNVSEETAGINELTSQFVGPFVLGFATWVLRRAQELGIKRLYFVARDGQLISKVAGEIAPQFGIECRYLYASRQALYLAAVADLSPEGMPGMRKKFEQPILDRLLAKIELRYEDVESSLGRMAGAERGSYRLRDEQDWARFWSALTEEPLKARLLELIRTRREAAVAYYQEAGLFDPVPWSLVDLGWNLTCQQSLRTLVRSVQADREFYGLYLELVQYRVPPGLSGPSEALFYEAPHDVLPRPPNVCRNPTLLEHVIGCADHPSVHHYEDARPVFRTEMKPEPLQFCRDLHEEVLRFAKANLALVDEFATPTICRDVLFELVTSFTCVPTRRIALLLSTLLATEDQNNLNAQRVIQPVTLFDAVLPFLPPVGPMKGKLSESGSFWPEASAVLSPPALLRLREFGMKFRRANLRLRAKFK